MSVAFLSPGVQQRTGKADRLPASILYNGCLILWLFSLVKLSAAFPHAAEAEETIIFSSGSLYPWAAALPRPLFPRKVMPLPVVVDTVLL